MALSLAVVQALAPDQGVLDAAGKLLQPRHWVRVCRSDAHAVAWGECQGSGANPYLVVADTVDHGYKCTCPSRKFPCKHVVALMWQFAETPQRFDAHEAPSWVVEWLGRRRRSGGGPAVADAAGKSLASARTGDPPTDAPSAEDLQKRERAATRRKAEVEQIVRTGLGDLDQWLRDQLRAGVASFVDDSAARCRRIAARLVDAKCAVLASRVDELSARLLALPRALRVEAALYEFGQWVVLARAWSSGVDDPDARSAVLQAPTREAVIADDDSLRVDSTWEVVGVRTESRRDGLVSQATWLLDVCNARPRFALLQDFFPASVGKRVAAFTPGERLRAELVFYPSRYPLRAVVAHGDGGAVDAGTAISQPSVDPLAAHRAHLAAIPWAPLTPLLLGAGALRRDAREQLWWVATDGAALRVAALADDAIWRGTPLHAAAALWNGQQAVLLKLDTPLGAAYPDD